MADWGNEKVEMERIISSEGDGKKWARGRLNGSNQDDPRWMIGVVGSLVMPPVHWSLAG